MKIGGGPRRNRGGVQRGGVRPPVGGAEFRIMEMGHGVRSLGSLTR